METTKVAPRRIDVLVTAERGITAEEAFRKAGEKNLVVVSNKTWDSLLVGSDEWKKAREALTVWTGTMVAYAEPDKALGKFVEFEDKGITWVFPVPAKWQGEKDVALVVEHPNFTIEVEGNRRIIIADEKHVSLVRNFPAEDGWYKTDSEHGIPNGEQIDSEDARYLVRINSARVGPVARGLCRWDAVLLPYRPSFRFGVAVEASGAGAPEN